MEAGTQNEPKRIQACALDALISSAVATSATGLQSDATLLTSLTITAFDLPSTTSSLPLSVLISCSSVADLESPEWWYLSLSANPGEGVLIEGLDRPNSFCLLVERYLDSFAALESRCGVARPPSASRLASETVDPT